MTKIPATFGLAAQVRIALGVGMMLLTALAVAQTGAGPATKATPPPNWEAQWVGMYAGQDQPGKVAPPGFTVLNPWTGMEVMIAKHTQPWALARREVTIFELEDPGTVCKLTGLFIVGAGGQSGFELLASPGKITLVSTGGGGVVTGGIRRIYMNRPHLRNVPLTWNGDSVGHWEGDTLVIDTIGYNDKSWLSGDRTRHSEELHTIERIRFVANGTWLEDTWWVDDPMALTSPFLFTRYHKKLPAETPMEENLCNDTPEIRKAWLRLYKRAEKEAAEARAAASEQDAKK